MPRPSVVPTVCDVDRGILLSAGVVDYRVADLMLWAEYLLLACGVESAGRTVTHSAKLRERVRFLLVLVGSRSIKHGTWQVVVITVRNQRA